MGSALSPLHTLDYIPTTRSANASWIREIWRQRDKAAAPPAPATLEFMNLLYVTPPQHLICMPIPSPEWQNLFKLGLWGAAPHFTRIIYICSAHVHLPHGRRVKAVGMEIFGHDGSRSECFQLLRVDIFPSMFLFNKFFRVYMFLQIPLEWSVTLLKSWISIYTYTD